ncbi:MULTISPECIES: ArsR/SmtB family transcription factor [Kitasatospora]|uniref:ArsR/SmtB family transcription factor n=1 Tax=Kitasatospora TaxID=2063 RepID=UPI000C6FD3FA|nr:helix-turn-helix domain-containing protein [Kitasatospora sp. GP30]MDH6138136.1 DNA-binding transcriptional ArsR family regulator [Kitasatospora sp. GP30]
MQERPEPRLVDDVATLKALADPVRLAILSVLRRHDPQPLTAKELATELDEPQTKLYRHLKQLEKVELIEVAGTRLVSGIVESRYRARQTGLSLAPSIFAAGTPERPEALAALLAAMDAFRRDFEQDFLNDRIDLTLPEDGAPGFFAHSTFRLTPEHAARLRVGLRELLAEATRDEVGPGEDGVEVKLFAILYGGQP